LESRLSAQGRAFQNSARDEIRAGCDATRFCGLISLASRHVPQTALSPTREELAAAQAALPGWNPERWNLRETSRVDLVLSRNDQGDARGHDAIEAAFAYADMGEACALYKSLAHLPGPERFVARAAEGARTNIRAVFESAICDTPFPAEHFDDVAWRQCVIKALFIEAPLWRVHGLDRRLDAELARMALDLAEERRSAGRHVNPQLWLCLGAHAGERGLRALLGEWKSGTPAARAAAALGLGRVDAKTRERADLDRLVASEQDFDVLNALRQAKLGNVRQSAFQPFDGPVPKVV
jgi:hypothetical protein